VGYRYRTEKFVRLSLQRLTAKYVENRHFYIVVWLSQILSLETFTEICQKVYFAVAAYKQTDFILANACLIWLFSEFSVITGQGKYLEYSTLCRRNLEQSLARLPLVLPATMEVVACLTLGVRSHAP
jgi:hypothetical protein